MYQENVKIYDEYLKSNKARNYETFETTYKMYKSRINDFFNYLKENENDIMIISEKMIKDCVNILERYISDCRDRGNNNQTINNKITAISSFYIWCVKRNIIEYHPFQTKLDRLKKSEQTKRRESYFLSAQEIIEAKVMMKYENFKMDERLMWELFLDCGARISAIQSIKVGQIDFNSGIIKGVKEKYGKIVDLMFFENTAKILKDYIYMNDLKNEDYLFFSNRNKKAPMTQSTIRAKIKKIGLLIGYDKLYPHTLRKTAINLLYNMGGIELAAEYANHNDSKTTKDHYIKNKTTEENRDSIHKLKKSYGL